MAGWKDAPVVDFDAEGADYDMASARAAGLTPDPTGHWPSRDPQTGLLLKGRKHPTFHLTEQGEREAGMEIFQKDGRYYSRPKGNSQPAWASAPEVTPAAPAQPKPTWRKDMTPEEYAKAKEGLWGYAVGEEGTDRAGGAVTDFIAKFLPAEAAAGAGAVVKAGVPMVLGANAGAMAKPVVEGAAKRVMQSALKPNAKAIANGEAAQAIDTMLAAGVNATTGGAVKLRHLIAKVKAEVGQLISRSPAQVNRGHVYKELATSLDDVAAKGSGYKADQNAIMKAWDEFKNHPLLEKFGEVDDLIPIQTADKIKRATQKSVKDAYGRITTTPADDKAQMAIAAGLRKGMEEVEPGVAAMNAKLSEYVKALNLIEPKAAQAANRDLGGLVPLAHSPEAAMVMLADRNPWMKSYIARVLHQGRTTLPAGAGAATAGIATSSE